MSGITLGLEHWSAVPWAMSSSLSEDKVYQLENTIYTGEFSEEDENQVWKHKY